MQQPSFTSSAPVTEGLTGRVILAGALLPLTVLVGLIHHIAIAYYWYWLYWWTDVVMHTLGGALIALAAVWVVFYASIVKNRDMSTRVLFLVAVGSALCVGIGWEFFEYFAGMFQFENPFPDTWHDLIADTGGALMIFLFVRNLHPFGK